MNHTSVRVHFRSSRNVSDTNFSRSGCLYKMAMKNEGRKLQRKFILKCLREAILAHSLRCLLLSGGLPEYYLYTDDFQIHTWASGVCHRNECVIHIVFVLYHLKNVFKSNRSEQQETTWSHVVIRRHRIQAKEQKLHLELLFIHLKTFFSSCFNSLVSHLNNTP